MNDESKRNIGRDIPDGSADQEKQGRSFIQNNLEHTNYSFSKTIAILASIPIGAAFLIGVSAYKYGLTEVDSRIEQKAPNINNRVTDIEKDNVLRDYKLGEVREMKDTVNDMAQYFKAKGKR